jgi:hypothetical protein
MTITTNTRYYPVLFTIGGLAVGWDKTRMLPVFASTRYVDRRPSIQIKF